MNVSKTFDFWTLNLVNTLNTGKHEEVVGDWDWENFFEHIIAVNDCGECVEEDVVEL
jgi:hypothetical protein